MQLEKKEQPKNLHFEEIAQKWGKLLGKKCILLKTFIEGNKDNPISTRVCFDENQSVFIEQLSSGELKSLLLAINMRLFQKKNNLISLIDEPENNFHPRAQLNFADFYSLQSDNNNNQIFIATHSPFIIKSFLDKYKDETSIVHFNKKDN